MKVDNPTKARPVLHRVLVQIEKVKKKTAGGILLPEAVVNQNQLSFAYGTVVAIGPTAFKDYGDGSEVVEVGDKVCFVRHGGTILDEDIVGEHEHDYRMINDIDIFAVIGK